MSNFRRIIRAQRLCAELGHADTLAALEQAKRMQQVLRVIATWARCDTLDRLAVLAKCDDVLTAPPAGA